MQLTAWEDVQPSLKEFGVKRDVKRSIQSIHSTVRQQGDVLTNVTKRTTTIDSRSNAKITTVSIIIKSSASAAVSEGGSHSHVITIHFLFARSLVR